MQMCMRRAEYLYIFDVTTRRNDEIKQYLDECILNAVLKNTSNYEHKLHLCLIWNRCDLMRMILSNTIDMSKSKLYSLLERALLEDKTDFVKTLIASGVDFNRFLTIDRLERLYNPPSHVKTPINTLHTILRDVHFASPLLSRYRGSKPTDEKVQLKHIGMVVELLMDIGTYESAYTSSAFRKLLRERRSSLPRQRDHTAVDDRSDSELNDMSDFDKPYNDIFVWTILTKRHRLAFELWHYGDELIAKALVAMQLNRALAREASDDHLEAEICEEFKNQAKKFAKLALSLLETTYQQDEESTLQLLTYELQNWGRQTCLSLAALADHKEFLSHPCCQILLNDLWLGGIRTSTYPNMIVIGSLLFPFYIPFIEYKTRSELKKQAQTVAEHIEDVESQDDDDDDDSESDYSSLVNSLSFSSKSTAQSRQSSFIDRNNRLPRHKMRQKKEKGKHTVHAYRKSSIALTQEAITDLRDEIDQHISHNKISIQKRIYEFYKAPISTFWAFTMAHIVFLMLVTYQCVVKTSPTPNFIQHLLSAYVANIALEQIRKIIIVDARSPLRQLHVYLRSFWNCFTLAAVALYCLALAMHLQGGSMVVQARIVYILDAVLWYLKLLQFLTLHPRVGPYIYMVAHMLMDLLYVSIILLVFLAQFGLVRQSIMYPYEEWSWHLVKHIFYKPYFMKYGEIYTTAVPDEITPCITRGEQCHPGWRLVPVFMAIYMIMSYYLLTSFMVAIFTNIYEKMNLQTKLIAKYQRFEQVMEFESMPPIPPPFTFLLHIYTFLKYCKAKFFGKSTRLNYLFDCGLKLFLDEPSVRRLHHFEQQCVELLENDDKHNRHERLLIRLNERLISAHKELTTIRNDNMNEDIATLNARLNIYDLLHNQILQNCNYLLKSRQMNNKN